jgi:hypothetical protein
MSKQPNALRLADCLDDVTCNTPHPAAAELRRLHALNGELLEALKSLLPILDKAWDFDGDVFGRLHNYAVDADMNARSAIAKAEGKI